MQLRLKTIGWVAVAGLGLSACAGSSTDDPRIAFNQTYQASAQAFGNAQGMAETDLSALSSPSASATYSGQSGLSISTDNATLEAPNVILQQGGDFLAVADVSFTIDLTQTNPTFTGAIDIVEADEGRTMSGSLALAGSVTASENIQAYNSGAGPDAFYGTITGTLTLDGNPLTITSGAFDNGRLVGGQADTLWASHSSNTSYQGIAGLISGGLYANAD